MSWKNRVQVTEERQFGEFLEWKDYHGWIRPQKRVDHPEAGKRGGKLYISKEDIEGPLPEPGSTVSFVVYSDDSGLGAMSCMTEEGGAPRAPGRGAAGGGNRAAQQAAREDEDGEDPAAQAGGRRRLVPERLRGVVTQWDGAQGTIELERPIQHADFAGGCTELTLWGQDVVPQGSISGPGARVTCFVFSDDMNLGAEACVEEKGDIGGPPGKRKPRADAEWPAAGIEERPPLKAFKANTKPKPPTDGPGGTWGRPSQELGPDLPRQRLTEVPVNGQVISFKGKVGWIKPDEPLEHQLAQKHKGDIYLHIKDVMEGESPEKGKAVNFHVYADKSGLGAEECFVLPA